MRINICLLLLLANLSVFPQTPSSLITSDGAKDLIPEGIAYDEKTGDFYVSSIHQKKIIKIDKAGHTTDFIPASHDGYMEGLGMKVDNKRSLLWAVSVAEENKQYICGVHGFDLQSGKTIHHFELKDTVPHLFNDLVIDNKGTLWITDTYYGAIYKASDKLVLFCKDSLLSYCNGIAIPTAGKLIVTSYPRGPMLIDTKNKNIRQIKGITDNKIARGLDGIVMFDNSIIAVFNGSNNVAEQAVVQFKLNAALDSVVTVQYIDKGNPYFQEPTTAAIAGNKLYILANSYIEMYFKNKKSLSGIEEKMGPVRILEYTLD
jgi:sugar lactone lactonase YvrE